MTNPRQTGSFWLCPQCRKHVPSRLSVCKCGFDREATRWRVQEVQSHLVEPPVGEERSLPGRMLPAIGIALVLGASGYLAARSWLFPPEETNKAEKFRKMRQGGTIVIQGPSPSMPPLPENPPAAATPTPIVAPADALDARLAEVQPVAERIAAELHGVAPAVPQPAAESDLDATRRTGAEAFARSIAAAAAKADQADVAWGRYSEGCRENVIQVSTTSVAVAAVGDRDWFGIAGAAATSTVTMSQWTEACAEIGTFLALITQVHGAVCQAEDRARQSHVYPGVRRDIRQRYRLEWYGWDHFCPSR